MYGNPLCMLYLCVLFRKYLYKHYDKSILWLIVVRAKSTTHAKEIIFKLDGIEGVYRTETMISLEESINDKKRLMHSIFNDMNG